MKATNQKLNKSALWLLAVSAGLVAIHMSLVSQANDGSLAGSSLLYWLAIGSMIGSRQKTLVLKSDLFGRLSGIAVLALVLSKSASIHGYDPFLRVSPLLSVLGVALLASGFGGLRQYWKELSILAALAPPPSLLSNVVDTTVVTAKFSTALLWYLGFNVSREGTTIFLQGGGVDVYAGCSGIDTMLHLFGLSVLFLAMFPTSRTQKVVLPVVSIVIAFIVNGVRVAVMAVLSEPVNRAAFEYWHKGDGSLLFSMLAVFLLGIYCFFVSSPEPVRDEIA